MEIFIKILVCFFAGLGAGLGTGFAGMSAATVVAPMLIAFLDMEAYMAIGIALAGDVLASAVSSYTYYKNKNIDIRHGFLMMLFVLLFTVVGSWVASFIPNTYMGYTSTLMTLLIGIQFLIKPAKTPEGPLGTANRTAATIKSIVCGIGVGFICGFVGGGGGLTMLFVLTVFLGYELKTAVGTSVFIMTFTALTGAASHFAIGSKPDWLVLCLCALFTLIFAFIAAKIANRLSTKILNRIVGVLLLILGITVLIVKLVA